jgi:carnitine O-acetyltransferase
MNSARQLLLDDGTNRWYDKTIQLIVFANGRAGLYAEHALIDATVISRLLTDAMTEITVPNEGDAEYEINKQHVLPSKLEFEYDSKLDSMIVEAQGFYKNFIGQHHVHTEVFSNWGSSAIKKMGFSPDAFV